MTASLKYLVSLFAMNIKASFALRASFWLQAFFMLFNNVIFFVVWLIFFEHYDSIEGWQLGHIALIYGIVSSSWGVGVLLAGSMREISRTIVNGDLDSALTLPKNALIRVAASRSNPSGWGDLATGAILFTFSDVVSLADVPLILGCVICGAVIFVSFGVMVSSLAFWAGPTDDLAQQLIEFLMIFSIYPNHIFGWWLKVVLFTAIPAAFIGTLPVELIGNDLWWAGPAVVGATVVYASLALLVFSRGLKRYESGNRFGVQA